MKLDLKKSIKKYLPPRFLRNKPDKVLFVYILSGLVFLMTVILMIWFACQYFDVRSLKMAIVNPQIEEEKEAECDYSRVLDGICVEFEKDVNPKLVAVMIDNHYDSRPPTGLARARVVYEAPVEGNFTRFMAIYPADLKIEKVGPVRSARPYYLDWVREYGDAMYMHVGGSPQALDEIKQYQIFNVNEFYRGWYFWRSSDRFAPHNTYTSNKLWNKALKDYEDYYEVEEYEGWVFSTSTLQHINTSTHQPQSYDGAQQSNTSTPEELITDITISFLPPVFKPVWKYNSSTEQYERYQMGQPHQDEDGEQIVADTIIVQCVESKTIDAIGRKKITTVGEGEVLIFQKGEGIEGIWKKEESRARTQWYDKQGSIIKLNPGKIWVEVVGQDGGVSY